MRRYSWLLVIVASLSLVLAVGVACGDDDSDSVETPTPSSTGPPEDSPEVAGVVAAEAYLRETGVDGRKGTFTDPRSCAEVGDDPEGAFCIHEGFSVYAAGLVILRIANPEEADDEVWEVRLTKTDTGWEVTEAKPFGDQN
jgi:hypothetical protein